MSIVSMSDRKKKSIDRQTLEDSIIDEELYFIGVEEEYEEKIKTPEDEILADADRIILRMGNAIDPSKVILVDKNGKYLRTRNIDNDEMLSLFRNITKKCLSSDAELTTIKNRITKEYYKKMENN